MQITESPSKLKAFSAERSSLAGHLVVAVDDVSKIGEVAAHLLFSLLPRDRMPNVGLPTGGTAEGMYRVIVEKSKSIEREDSRHPSNWRTFNLDEYIGLNPEDPRSYHYYMREHLFRHIGQLPRRNFFPSVDSRYDSLIQSKGGLDVLVCGIGVPESPHLAFQERGASHSSRTGVVELSRATRLANARFFDNDPDSVPSHAISMGLQTIKDARNVIVMAHGETKAQSVVDALTLPKDLERPASSLHGHPSVTWVIDYSIAEKLPPNLFQENSLR